MASWLARPLTGPTAGGRHAGLAQRRIRQPAGACSHPHQQTRQKAASKLPVQLGYQRQQALSKHGMVSPPLTVEAFVPIVTGAWCSCARTTTPKARPGMTGAPRRSRSLLKLSAVPAGRRYRRFQCAWAPGSGLDLRSKRRPAINCRVLACELCQQRAGITRRMHRFHRASR